MIRLNVQTKRKGFSMGNRRSEINVVMSEILEDNQLMDISLADIVNKSFSEINVSQQEKMLIEALNAAE